MASRADVSFYRDMLHKPVVDCDGRPVGALLDLSAGPPAPTAELARVRSLVVRPRRLGQAAAVKTVGKPLIVPWELVASLDARSIRLRQPGQDLEIERLPDNAVLLHKHILDQQIVDCRGAKLHRVNDITMAFDDGRLCVRGMDTGVRGFLTRLGFHWGFLSLVRPLYDRLHHHVIRWDCVDRIEPTRGWIRLRISRDEIRSALHQRAAPPDA